MPNEKQPVSVVMCTWNEHRILPLALKSLKDFAQEFIIVDAGSNDGTIQAIQHAENEFSLNVTTYIKPSLKLRDARLYGFQKASCDWILVCDGDEVFHTDGPWNVHTILPPLLNAENVVYRFPMRYLYLDLEHTHREKARLPGHKTLYYNNESLIGRMPENRDLPKYDGMIKTIHKPVKFNCGVKDPVRVFLRERVWFEWSKESNTDMGIREYAKLKLEIEDLEQAAEEFIERRKQSENYVEYDPDEYGYRPKVIREVVGGDASVKPRVGD